MTDKLYESETDGHKEPLVCCVVLNWNGWQDTLECLRSLAGQRYAPLSVIVVDNGSTDKSVERIRAEWPGVELIEAEVNGGFAAGCNLGIRRALELGASFVWLLNNDTVVPPDTLNLLVAEAESDARNGITGSVLRYMHDPTRVQAWGGGEVMRWLGYTRHYTAPTEFTEDTFLTFASVLIRSEVFKQIGLMDDRYFMYYEDSDLCFRARTAGWRLTIARDTSILHKEGGSRNAGRSLATERIVTASGLHFLSLHAPVPWLAQILFFLSRIGKRALRLDFAAAGVVCTGAADWFDRRKRTAEDVTA